MKKSANGNSSSSRNVPEFLKKYLTSASASSTNRHSDAELMQVNRPRNQGPTYYRHFSKASSYLKKDGDNKHSIVSTNNNDELGHYTYYCHEDAKGEKVEYRNSKYVPLKDNKSESDGDSGTTSINSSQMKSEFRNRNNENAAKEKIYLKLMAKCTLILLMLI